MKKLKNLQRKDDYTNVIWLKNWSGQWSMCFCSFYGVMYTIGLKNLVGKNFKNNIVTFEPQSSSNFLPKFELTNFGKYLASLVIEDPKLAKKWSREVIERTDKIMLLIKSLDKKKKLSTEDFYTLRARVYEHVPPNFAVKRVADYLPMRLQNKFLKDFSYVRQYTEAVYNEVDRILKRIFKQISSETKINTDFFLTISHDELETYFQTGELPSKKDLRTRHLGCAIFYKNKNKELIFGKKYGKLKNAIAGNLSKQFIKGTPAYPGVAKGRVQIIFDPLKFQSFNKGDILVTGMTRPEYLSLMRKSGGFITDAGGMLSHAAIMARELQKPCIVGTEIATKVLKDGDIIELDANKGIVKVIDRHLPIP